MVDASGQQRGLQAGVSTLLAVAIGVLTNVATSSWAWPLIVGLVTLAVAWVVWEVRRGAADEPATGSRRQVRKQVDLIAAELMRLMSEPHTPVRRWVVVVVDGADGLFAQFLRSEAGLWAEISGPEFLQTWHRPSDEYTALMTVHGWSLPDEQAPNFHRNQRITDPERQCREFARLVFDTLVHVYGVDETDSLRVIPGSDD